MSDNGAGRLRQVLQDARGPGVSMSDLTVLAVQRDPYRLDTPAGHRDGAWVAEQLGGRRQHPRGTHYMIVSRGDVLKPNGQPYRNTDEDWTWLLDTAIKAARWLGYVGFDQITDNRNDPPIVHRKGRPEPWPYIYADVEVEIPDAVDIDPHVGIADFEGHQPYHLVIFCEKSSPHDELVLIAERYNIDLYMPTGEISDALLYRMAKDGAADGRPMQVFTLADCDPAGHQMPISIGRKLQALRDLCFPDLEFEVRPIALTVDQVHELGLPSTPLKETERRADKWRAAFGVEQTEIDALATLRPDVLNQIVRDAIAPFWDHDLWGRVARAKLDWYREAERAFAERVDADLLAEIREQAAAKLAALKDEIAAIKEGLRQAVPSEWGMEFPPIVIPEAETDESLHGLPLISSRWPWTDQTRALIERKSYGGAA